jgi:hypothetical protein
MMNFSKRLLILTLVPSGVLVAAALVGVMGVRNAEARFGEVFEKEQPLAQAVTEMYGHGLQTGQALRNHPRPRQPHRLQEPGDGAESV